MDNLSRAIHILRLIPQQPKSISTTEIWEKLKKNHFYKDLSQRTVQRDLQKIRETKLLPLDYQNSKPARWYLKKKRHNIQNTYD